MKRMMVLLLAVAFLTAAYLSGQSQQVPVAIPAATRVGAVNMGKVYTHYRKVTRMKRDMERALEPFKEKKRFLEESLQEWQAIKTTTDAAFSPETREMAAIIVIDCQRKLEDMEIVFKKELAKKFEDDMVALDKEIQESIRRHSRAHGYHLILAYGEPEVPLTGLTEFRRKMKVIDDGGMTVAYLASRLDVSDEILAILNGAYKEKEDGQ